MGFLARAVCGIALMSVGCGESESAPQGSSQDPPPDDCPAPNRRVGLRCIEPGVQDDGCAAGTRAASDGSCVPAGTPAELCAEGFVHDGDVGCEPVLPRAACAPGLMAVPGDAACRPVMACGAGKWGDIPVDGTTVYVDASSTSMLEVGTATDPYHSIGAAYTAAAPGALIAVAEGDYLEDVVIEMKPVRLWGVCPDKVHIVGSGTLAATVRIRPQTSGAEVHGVAITGPAGGLSAVGSQNIVIDRVRIHETGAYGFVAAPVGEPVSVVMTGVLVERSAGVGVAVSGGQVTLLQTVVRDTQPTAQLSGRGVTAFPCSPTDCGSRIPASLTARGVVVEQSRDTGVHVSGSDATLEGIVVRDTLPGSDQQFGTGIGIQILCTTESCDGRQRADVTLVGSLVERSHEVGVSVIGSDALIEATRVRSTAPSAANQTLGRGINVQSCGSLAPCNPPAEANASVVASLVEQSHEIGVAGFGATIAVDATVVRDTQPSAADGLGGRGVAFQDCEALDTCDPTIRGSAQMRGSIVERNHDIGLMVSATDATLEGVVVRDTVTSGLAPLGGRGLTIQLSCSSNICDPNARARGTVVGSLIERNLEFNVAVMSSDATFDGTLVRAGRASPDGLFGDGVAVVGFLGPADATLTSTRIVESARAGLAAWGASASLSRMAIECALFGLNVEPYAGIEAALHDLGDNACGCPTANAACKAQGEVLEPPAPI